jgi:2'-5' RNA ligase
MELADTVADALVDVQHSLNYLLPPGCISWTRPESLHLTLRFLGDVPEARIEELKAALVGAMSSHYALELTCEGLGCFPNLRFPRILWAGVHDARAATASGSSGNPELQPLAGARRELRRTGRSALPRHGRAALPRRRDFPPAREAMPAAGRPDDSSVPSPAGGNAREPTALPGLQTDALDRLQAAVSSACDPFAVKPDVQPFAGHVTLGRFRRLGREDSKQVARVIERFADRQFGKWTAGEVVLFRSELRPDGARHSPLERFPLRRDGLSR